MKALRCHCCGALKTDALDIDAVLIRHRIIGRRAILLRALAERASQWVSIDHLARLMLSGVDPERGPADEVGAVHLAMHFMRRTLAAEPLLIKSERFRGYRLLWLGDPAEGRKPDRASAGQAAHPEAQRGAASEARREG